MKRLALRELPSPAGFERLRPALRQAILAHKAARRLAVGNRVTLLFEDRETVRWQVLEMCRVEGLGEPAAVQHELDVYNELVPGEGELSATLFIEITDLAEIRPELDRLVGIDEALHLQIGPHRLRASFDEKQMEEDRISAVHYVRFPVPGDAAAALAEAGTEAAIEIDHPAYGARAELRGGIREQLLRDLAGGAGELVPAGDVPRADEGSRDQVLETRGAVRVVRPARPRAPGHRIVEPAEPAPPFPDAPAELLAALFALAQDVARGVEAKHGSCRVSTDATTPLRIDVYAPTT